MVCLFAENRGRQLGAGVSVDLYFFLLVEIRERISVVVGPVVGTTISKNNYRKGFYN